MRKKFNKLNLKLLNRHRPSIGTHSIICLHETHSYALARGDFQHASSVSSMVPDVRFYGWDVSNLYIHKKSKQVVWRTITVTVRILRELVSAE